MSKQCEIIQDLLPLYVDDACSQSSTEMIKEHLKTCQPCSEIYQQMNSHTNEIILKKEKDGVIARHSRKIKNKRERYAKISERALEALKTIIEEKL